MRRRRRVTDREFVPVEPVEPVDDGHSPDGYSPTPLSSNLDSGVDSGVGVDVGFVTPDDSNGDLAAFAGNPSVDGNTWTRGRVADPGVADEPVVAVAPGDASAARRSTPWPIIGVVVVLLAGFLAWSLTRSSGPESALPEVPLHSEFRYSFEADGFRADNVTVFGAAEQVYVAAFDVANDPPGVLYSLDSIGNPRWTADIGIGNVVNPLIETDDQLLVAVSGISSSGEPVTTTLTLVDKDDGSTLWQNSVSGFFAQRLGDQIAVFEEVWVETGVPNDPGATFPSMTVRIVDVDEGRVLAEQQFDQIPLQFFFGEFNESILVQHDGTTFLVDETLRAVSEPIAIDDGASSASDGNEILVVDDRSISLYGLDGQQHSSEPLDDRDGDDDDDLNDGFWAPSMSGVWLYASFNPDPWCAAYDLADGLIEVWRRPGCIASALPPTAKGSRLVTVDTVSWPNDANSLIGDDRLEQILADGDVVALGANGIVTELDGQLIGTNLDGDSLFTLDLADDAVWSLIEGGIVIIGGGSSNTLTIEVYS